MLTSPLSLPLSTLPTHSVPYAALTHTFSKIAATTKRLEISAYLTHFLVNVIDKTPEDLLKVVYLCINRVRLVPLCFFLFCVAAVEPVDGAQR